MNDKMKNRGSALLMTLLWAGLLSICSLMMFTSGMTQLKLQRRILMQENNFCYLEQRMEELCPAVSEMTDEAAKECGEKALKEAARAAREKAAREKAEKEANTAANKVKEEAKTAANEAAKEAKTAPNKAVGEGKSTSADAGKDEIDMRLARELYRERIFRKLKRSLRQKELEKLLMKETAPGTPFGTMSEIGRKAATDDSTEISVMVESVEWDRDTILVKGLRLSGSAPGSWIRSSVSADLRISIPELEDEADSEHEEGSEHEEDSEQEADSGHETAPANEAVSERDKVPECGTASEAKSSFSAEAPKSELQSQVTLEHFRREKRKFRR